MTVQSAIDMLNMLGAQYEVAPNGCWNYTGKMTSSRPVILMGSKGTTAGRVICTIVNGPPPSSTHQAGHSCHNSMCIFPEHFRWEEYADNQVKNDTGLPTGIRQRKDRGGRYEAHTKKNGKHYYQSFSNIEQAVKWIQNIKESHS